MTKTEEKTEELKSLFDKWNDNIFFEVFMKDGIVCEKLYEGIMFMLKDVNNAKPDDTNDMRVDVQTSMSGGKTWFDVASWTSGLLDGVFIESITHDIQHQQLKRVAIMNLKKEAGGPKANYAEIKEHSRKWRENILEEIRICNPKLVVACSRDVFEIFVEEVLGISSKQEFPKIEFNEKMKSFGRYLDFGSYIGASAPVYIVEYRHPSRCGSQGTRKEHFENMVKIRNNFIECQLN